MTFTIGDLAVRLQCDILRGEPTQSITGVQNLAEASTGDLAPFTDEQYSPILKTTQASAILVKRGASTDAIPAASAILSSTDPEMAFLGAVRLFHPDVVRAPGIHPTAVIDPSVEIGTGAHIGPHVYIESGARIGEHCTILASSTIGGHCIIGNDCTLHPRVTLYAGTKVGNRVVLHSGVVLGADGFGYKFRGGKHVKVPHVGSVVLGDDVEIGANTCIDRGTLGTTRVGSGTKIDNLVQVGHNNDIGQHCILCGNVSMAGSCKLDDYVVLAGGVGVADHTQLGKGARVGAMSGVMGTVPPGAEYWGAIARDRKTSVRAYAALQHLPELVARVRTLEKKLQAE